MTNDQASMTSAGLALRIGWWAKYALLCIATTAAARAEPSAEHAQFFETKIRPILVENCHKCHGEKKQSGGLRLDSAAAMLAGGESGAAVVPGESEKGPLVEAINY